MEKRAFGRSGLMLSLLGFGCGAVGGLMVRGEPRDQERAVGMARDAGVNYFDTAVQYGDGASETNLGRALNALKLKNAVVGTKVRLPAADFGRIRAAVTRSLEGSLKRLGRERADIFHLHNAITLAGGGENLSARQVLDEVVPAFQELRRQGKIGFVGITAIGETAALHRVIDARVIDSAQVVYNILNPSAGAALPERYPAQDYGRLLERTAAAGTGVIAIRVLAGGALSGDAYRHPIASPPPEPIGSAATYEGDLARAQRLLPAVPFVFAQSLTEAAVRFVIANRAVGTVLVGIATVEQFAQALAAVEQGPLPQAGIDRLAAVQQSFAGEAR